MCRCSWNVATDKWKVHNGEIADLLFYSHEADFIQGLLKKKKQKKLA
jgi:hypothetical protein